MMDNTSNKVVILPAKWERLQYSFVRITLQDGRKIEKAVYFQGEIFKIPANVQPKAVTEDIQRVQFYPWREYFSDRDLAWFKQNAENYYDVPRPPKRFWGFLSVDVKLKNGKIYRDYCVQSGRAIIGKIVGGQTGVEDGNIPFSAPAIAEVQVGSPWIDLLPPPVRKLFGKF